MPKSLIPCVLVAWCFLTSTLLDAQVVQPLNDSLSIETSDTLLVQEFKLLERNPTKAALYSAVLPGAGQLYNRKYWKIPLIYGLLGTGAGFIAFYNSEYNAGRKAYLNRLNGLPVEQRFATASIETLADFQDDQRRYRDYTIALTALVYLLNVIDAAVDAHLHDINQDKDLSFEPAILQNPNDFRDVKPGLALRFRF